jgi:hypothetical protein
MFSQEVHVTMLYVGDGTQFLLFVVGLASLFEFFAQRSTSRLLIELSPRQVAAALAAQLVILMIALLGFKYVVLMGGPGIATHHILRDGGFTKGFSASAMVVATVLCVWGFMRLARVLRRKIILKSY